MFQDPLAVFPAARSCLAGALSDRTRNSQQRVVAKSAQGKPGDYYKSTYTTIANGCQGLIWGEKTPHPFRREHGKSAAPASRASQKDSPRAHGEVPGRIRSASRQRGAVRAQEARGMVTGSSSAPPDYCSWMLPLSKLRLME